MYRDIVRRLLPDRGLRLLRRAERELSVRPRIWNGEGELPDFIIAGAQKSGTTSLYNYLIQHPDVKPSLFKEVHFFDVNYSQGINWYRAFFPECSEESPAQITGEASPYYMFHPLVADRMQEQIPEVKLLFLLRDPIERAYSHYQHNRRKGREPLSFYQAVNREEKRLKGEKYRVQQGTGNVSLAHRHYSYKSRGRYLEQIERFDQKFDRDQMLVLFSQELLSRPDETMEKVFSFLDLSPEDLDYQLHNQGDYKEISDKSRSYLEDYFKSHNRNLFNYLDRKCNSW